MDTTERAAALRALADQLDGLGGLEQAAAEAKAAYRDDPSETNKAAHRAASAALNAARAESRSSSLKTVDGGGVSITPAPVGSAVKAG